MGQVFDGKNKKILDLSKLLILPAALPEKAETDAMHIAAAAVEKCDFLLTWNLRHIANTRIRREVDAAEHDHDLDKIFEDLKRSEVRSKLRRVPAAKK